MAQGLIVQVAFEAIGTTLEICQVIFALIAKFDFQEPFIHLLTLLDLAFKGTRGFPQG